MAKVLVIPDTHLKPKMFDLADAIICKRQIDYAIQLGDNLDDFYCYAEQYERHFKRMEKFADDHPNTIWLHGNHEISYILHRPVTGNTAWGHKYAFFYHQGVFRPKMAHKSDKVVFSHAGIFQEFLNETQLDSITHIDDLVETLNNPLLIPTATYWRNNSPIWARPQFEILETPAILKEYIQIIGHTPMKDITNHNNIISTDVFSTSWGKKLGPEKMIIVDTADGSYETIDIDFRKAFGENR